MSWYESVEWHGGVVFFEGGCFSAVYAFLFLKYIRMLIYVIITVLTWLCCGTRRVAKWPASFFMKTDEELNDKRQDWEKEQFFMQKRLFGLLVNFYAAMYAVFKALMNWWLLLAAGWLTKMSFSNALLQKNMSIVEKNA